MQYGQIVFLLFIAMLCYYAIMIVMDIRKEMALRAAEQEQHTEEDIDISDEAKNFKPTLVSRKDPNKQSEEKYDASLKDSPSKIENPADKEDASAQKTDYEGRIVYREAIMTDGILVENIIDEINQLAETGTSDLGAVIFSCEHAR